MLVGRSRDYRLHTVHPMSQRHTLSEGRSHWFRRLTDVGMLVSLAAEEPPVAECCRISLVCTICLPAYSHLGLLDSVATKTTYMEVEAQWKRLLEESGGAAELGWALGILDGTASVPL